MTDGPVFIPLLFIKQNYFQLSFLQVREKYISVFHTADLQCATTGVVEAMKPRSKICAAGEIISDQSVNLCACTKVVLQL